MPRPRKLPDADRSALLAGLLTLDLVMRDGIVTYEALRDTVARTHFLPQTASDIARLRERLLEGPLYAETP
jgi:hypothetical protein